MIAIDTNIVLRYILNDHAELSPRAKEIVTNNEILIITQVVAEVIYVLSGVYKSSRQEISDVLLSINTMGNVHFENSEVVVCAINEFSVANIDFVDSLLYSRQKLTGEKIATFDKKLLAKLNALP